MNRRIRKKLAKAFLETGRLPGRCILRTEEWAEPENGVRKEALVVPGRLRTAIRSEAFRRGWNGCHWDDPLLISIDQG